MREENVKHFRFPDGSYEAVVYSHSVHRKDSTGKWIEIDNSITEKAVGGVKQYTTPDTRIKFTSSDSNYPRMVLSDEGYSVSLELIGSASYATKEGTRINDKILNPVINNSDREEIKIFSSIEEAKRIENTSSIKYEDVRVNTDIEYILKGMAPMCLHERVVIAIFHNGRLTDKLTEDISLLAIIVQRVNVWM